MVKKQQWYELISPNVFGNKVVGETITDEPKKLINKVVPVSGKELTGDLKKGHITIKLRITEVNELQAKTVIHSYHVQRQYLQRFIRKGYTTLDLVTDAKTEDGFLLRVKCAITAPGKLQANVRKELRNKVIAELNKIINSSKLDNLIFLVIAGKVQHGLSKRAQRIHPVKLLEVKKIEITRKK